MNMIVIIVSSSSYCNVLHMNQVVFIVFLFVDYSYILLLPVAILNYYYLVQVAALFYLYLIYYNFLYVSILKEFKLLLPSASLKSKHMFLQYPQFCVKNVFSLTSWLHDVFCVLQCAGEGARGLEWSCVSWRSRRSEQGESSSRDEQS